MSTSPSDNLDRGGPQLPWTYHDTIPTLLQLMPETGGVPGVEYLQCSTQRLRRAQDEGWVRMHGGRQKVYTIVGPKGRCDCELYARGNPIVGQSHDSGARNCEVDLEIYQITGIENLAGTSGGVLKTSSPGDIKNKPTTVTAGAGASA